MKDLIIEQRAFGMDHPWKRIYSVAQFDKEFPIGPWNSCVELRLRAPGAVWSTNYKNTRTLVEAYFAE